MKLYLQFIKRFLVASPLLASSAFFSTPVQAATFALSQGELKFTNFNEEFAAIERLNEGNTFGFANGGEVNQTNRAVTDFIPSPATASTSALSLAFGLNKDYFGLAQTEAKIVGNFDVDAGQSFIFDFTAALYLRTAIEEAPAENARASGDISFLLLDTTNVAQVNLSEFIKNLFTDTRLVSKITLDFFALNGSLNTFANNDYLENENSPNVTLTKLFKDFDFEGKEEFASALVAGSLQRSFSSKTNLTLLAIRESEARVSAPEPIINPASLLLLGLVAIAAKIKSKVAS
jgi:hypothetical protein